jgi:hypothetical protein
MPVRHGLEVSIIHAGSGESFTEYSTQNIRGPASEGKLVSTRIRVRDGEQFFVKVTPQWPFPYHNQSRYDLRSNKTADLEMADVPDLSTEQQTPDISGLPFDLLVRVYIDGTEMPECSLIISLRKSHWTNSTHTGGTLHGRMTSIQGKMCESGWVFSEFGIETLMSRVSLSKQVPTLDERDMMDMTKSLQEGLLPAGKRSQKRQIEIQVSRVVRTGSGKFRHMLWERKDESNNDDRLGESDDKVEDDDSTFEIKHKKATETSLTRGSFWDYFDKDETMWAKYTFQYVSLDRLVSMGLAMPDGSPRERGSMKALCPPPPANTQTSMKRLQTYDPDDTSGDKEPAKEEVSSSDDHNSSDDDDDSSSSDDEGYIRPRKRLGGPLQGNTLQMTLRTKTPGTSPGKELSISTNAGHTTASGLSGDFSFAYKIGQASEVVTKRTDKDNSLMPFSQNKEVVLHNHEAQSMVVLKQKPEHNREDNDMGLDLDFALEEIE